MAKTIDNAVFGVKNLMMDFYDASTPRETFGIEGYREFIRESSNISDERTRNKIRYNSYLGKASDEFCKRSENFGPLDSKRDKALHRLNSVDDLVEQGKKYISKLDDLADSYEALVSRKGTEILAQEDALSLLKEQYTDLKTKHDAVKQEKVTTADKVKNVFYAIFDKKKVKKAESEANMIARVELENKMNSFENEILYSSGMLRDNKKEFRNLNNKLKSARRESWKVSAFLENSDNIKNFYQTYMDNSKEELFPMREDRPSVTQHIEETLGAVGTDKYVPSLKLKRHMAEKDNDRKKAIDNFMTGFLVSKKTTFNFRNMGYKTFDELTDYVVAPKVNYDIPFEVEDRRNIVD